MDQFAYFFDLEDYLELKVADMAISSSSHRQTASIKEIKIYVREVAANFTIFFKGSDFLKIEQYGTELTRSRDIITISHWMKIT